MNASMNYRNLMTFEAGENLKKYRFVSIDTGDDAGTIKHTADGAVPIGIVIIPAKKGQQASVLTQPGTRGILELDDTTTTAKITAGSRIRAKGTGGEGNANKGRAEVVTGAATKLYHAVVLRSADGGEVLKAGSNEGKYVSVLFTPSADDTDEYSGD